MTPEEQLRALYAAPKPDQRAIALLEKEVWGNHLRELNGHGARRNDRHLWFAERFGLDKPAHVIYRESLLRNEAWAAPLWQLARYRSLHSIHQVCRALKDTRDRAQEAERLARNPRAVVDFLSPSSKAGANKSVQPSAGEAKALRAKILALVKPFVAARLRALEEPTLVEDMVTQFDAEVNAALDDLLSKVSRLRGSSPAMKVTRRRLRWACECLGLPVPKKGGVIDMEVARKAHRRLSGQLHPDRTNGDDECTEQYRAVQEAWQVLSDYQA